VQVRLQSHGGSTPAPPGRVCVRASQKSQFRRLTCASQRARAGGVSSAWSTKRLSSGTRLLHACIVPCRRLGAEGVGPPCVVRGHTQQRPPTHRSAVSPTVAVAPLQVRQRDTRRADARRSCVWRPLDGEKATFALHKRVFAATRAGGVSPPWRSVNALARECDFCDVRTHVHKSGRREPPVVTRPRL